MEIEVGMYVRFNYHRVTVPIQISKIKEKHYEDIERYYYYLTDNGLVISEEQILKASHSLLGDGKEEGVIEVGDYVNGELVLEKVLYGNNAGVKVFGDIYYIEDIKSIVTKEQFEAIKYEVK